mmetsp:Transcript_2598/g.5537  ORF Transcript_2598/g.5537 Transcript_2598/m.5537 type:complete len:369 (-) Transcript_2598:65-1171(-)
MTKLNRWRGGGQGTAGDEEAPPPTALPNSPSSSTECSVGNESEPGSGRPARKQLQHKLSAVSRMYDVDGDGVLNETEKAMRDLDGSDRGFISNEKVYKIMEQSLHLQHQMFNLKRILIGSVVFTVILALSNLATAFIAASLAKDTAVSQPSSTSSPTLTDKAGHDLATLNKGIAIDATTVEKTFTPQNDAQRALFGKQNTTTATEDTAATTTTDAKVDQSFTTGLTFLNNYISKDKAESIFQSCIASTPSTIAHVCDGSQTITRIGCDYASRAENRFYTFDGGLKILCDLYSDNMRASDSMGGCLIMGLQCGNVNRVGNECGAGKPNYALEDDGTSECGASCECSSGCCASFTTPICLPEAPKGLFCI